MTNLIFALFYSVVSSVSVDQKLPKLHILSIGINDNLADDAFDLYYAKNDAVTIFNHWAGQVELYERGKQILMVETVTKAALLDTIKTFSNYISEKDLFVFFYSGHGLYFDEEYYLLTSDYIPAHLRLALKRDLLFTRINDVIKCTKIFFFDACNSAGFAKIGHKNIDGEYLKKHRNLSNALEQTDKPVYIVTSSSSDKNSYENPFTGMGFFTQALDAAFSKKETEGIYPTLLEDAFLTINGLDDYLKQAIPILTRDTEGEQDIFSARIMSLDFPIFKVN